MIAVRNSGLFEAQDRKVVREVVDEDCYCVDLIPPGSRVLFDVGAHIGSFSALWRSRHPAAKIVCVEACPENIPLLQENVGGFADVVHAACTYETGPTVLLNSVSEHGTATGGSTLVRVDDPAASTFGHVYWRDFRPVEKLTLETLMERSGVGFIDVLKLDCEGSEFSILEHAPLDRIGFIVGEYHGEERWAELLRRRFNGWSVRVLSTHKTKPLGLFHLWR